MLTDVVLSWVGPSLSEEENGNHHIWVARPTRDSSSIVCTWQWWKMDRIFQSKYPAVFAVHSLTGRTIIGLGRIIK
jgi:hypothetical protein